MRIDEEICLDINELKMVALIITDAFKQTKREEFITTYLDRPPYRFNRQTSIISQNFYNLQRKHNHYRSLHH